MAGDDRDVRGPRDPRDERRPRRVDWDVRGILAFLAVIGAFAIQGALIANGNGQEMPPWVVGLVSAIVAFYFGSRAGNGDR